MSGEVYAIEIGAYDKDAAAATTLYFTQGQGFCSRPGDTPANTHFEPRVIEAGNFSRYLVDELITDGRSRAGYGEIILNNADGGLDALHDYGLDGRALVIRRGRAGAAYPAAWTTVFTGTMSQAEVTLEEVRILLRDRQAEVTGQPFQATKYAGDNSLPAGVEGVAEDLKGKPKPRLYGKARNFAPPMVNTSKLTFQISDKQINSIDAVYVGGAALSAGTGHGSLANLQAATVSAGTYDYYLGGVSDGAYFRMGSSPDNVVTCDATQGAAAGNRTAAQTAKQILLDMGISSGDIDSASVTALDTANSAVVGLWTGTVETPAGRLLDEVLGSVGAWWNVNAAGDFIFGRLVAPSGTAKITLREWHLLRDGGVIERLRAKGEGDGLPAWRVALSYRKNHTVQQGADVVAAVSDAKRAQLAEAWATVVAEDAAVKTAHLLAVEKQVESLIDDATAAGTEASRMLALHKEKRDFVRVKMADSELRAMLDEEGVDLELGDVVELVKGRFGWGGGKKFALVGLSSALSADEAILELWG